MIFYLDGCSCVRHLEKKKKKILPLQRRYVGRVRNMARDEAHKVHEDCTGKRPFVDKAAQETGNQSRITSATARKGIPKRDLLLWQVKPEKTKRAS